TTYYNKFFFFFNSQFYRIDTSGNIKAFGYSPVPQVQNGIVSQMFTIDGYLFAVGTTKFFVSKDKGESWALFSDETGSLYTSLAYHNVGNELYATYESQIWRVTLIGNSLTYRELDNDGLQTNHITSVNKTGKYAFVTTLAGLFYRDTATFNQPKR
ncbi:MAG TPA: hypothetical protein VJU78_09735, partial [Chitinophagaceae bacterium]|nr:hypothetical protein [Chitinophagaceae bacterium]